MARFRRELLTGVVVGALPSRRLVVAVYGISVIANAELEVNGLLSQPSRDHGGLQDGREEEKFLRFSQLTLKREKNALKKYYSYTVCR